MLLLYYANTEHYIQHKYFASCFSYFDSVKIANVQLLQFWIRCMII